MNDIKRFEIYVFGTTFSRALIEVFIPAILFKFGYTFHEILLYYAILNVFALLFCKMLVKLSMKRGARVLNFIGIGAFVLLQILLYVMVRSKYYLILLAFVYSLYRRAYWIARRYYNITVVTKKHVGKEVGMINIVNQIAVMAAGYIGALILDLMDLKVLTLLVGLIYIISSIPLNKIKINKKKDLKDYYDFKNKLKETYKKIALKDLIIIGVYSVSNVFQFLYPLYLLIYIKDTYQTIGLINLVCNIASIIFVYIFSFIIDKNKKDYIRRTNFVLCIIYLLKININTLSALMIIALLEGIAVKFYDVTFNERFYKLSKDLDINCINLIYEYAQNFFRLLMTIIILTINLDIKISMHLIIIIMLINSVIKFVIKSEEKEKKRV